MFFISFRGWYEARLLVSVLLCIGKCPKIVSFYFIVLIFVYIYL